LCRRNEAEVGGLIGGGDETEPMTEMGGKLPLDRCN